MLLGKVHAKRPYGQEMFGKLNNGIKGTPLAGMWVRRVTEKVCRPAIDALVFSKLTNPGLL